VSPCTEVKIEDQVHDKTKSGTTIGTMSRIAHTRRPGSAVRSVSHAMRVPITARSKVTTKASRIVFHSSVATKSRSSTDHT